MNKTSDEVALENEQLVEVLDCHQHYGGDEPKGLVVKVGRKTTTVIRKELFAFVQDHGERCGKMQ